MNSDRKTFRYTLWSEYTTETIEETHDYTTPSAMVEKMIATCDKWSEKHNIRDTVLTFTNIGEGGDNGRHKTFHCYIDWSISGEPNCTFKEAFRMWRECSPEYILRQARNAKIKARSQQ